MNGVVPVLSVKRIFLVIFQDECDKDLNSNQLTIVIIDRSPVTEEASVLIMY